MEKMRVTMHGGRGSAKHNEHEWMEDRDIEKIFVELDGKVSIYLDPDEGPTVEQHELGIYENMFSDKLEETNQKYRSRWQYDRIRDMSSWMKAGHHAPREVILQIGKMENQPPQTEEYRETLRECVLEFIEWKKQRLGDNMTVISATLHFDEKTSHVQLRETYYSHDKNGNRVPGIKAALKEAGVELPDPTRKEGNDNYRLATLDAEAREAWQKIVIAHGFDIEIEPDESRKKSGVGHMSKKAWAEYCKAKQGLDARSAVLDEREASLNEYESILDKRADEQKKENDDLTWRISYCAKREDDLDDRQTEIERQEQNLKWLKDDLDRAADQLDEREANLNAEARKIAEGYRQEIRQEEVEKVSMRMKLADKAMAQAQRREENARIAQEAAEAARRRYEDAEREIYANADRIAQEVVRERQRALDERQSEIERREVEQAESLRRGRVAQASDSTSQTRSRRRGVEAMDEYT